MGRFSPVFVLRPSQVASKHARPLGEAERLEVRREGGLLAAISDPARPVISERVVLIFAHPDDETLACGALLPRMDDVVILHVTDGAPRNGDDARSLGYTGFADYAAARQRELRTAMRLAGVSEDRLISLHVADQGASFALAETARRLVPVLAEAEVIITHAYEGGHPDHDAVCWSVHAASRIVARQGRAPGIIEVPLYRLGLDGSWLRQSFAEGPPASLLRLTEADRKLKDLMLAAHASQARTLSGFGAADELYRTAPDYDFSQPPNDGALLYEHYGWGLTGGRWLELVSEAARELGLERAA